MGQSGEARAWTRAYLYRPETGRTSVNAAYRGQSGPRRGVGACWPKGRRPWTACIWSRGTSWVQTGTAACCTAAVRPLRSRAAGSCGQRACMLSGVLGRSRSLVRGHMDSPPYRAQPTQEEALGLGLTLSRDAGSPTHSSDRGGCERGEAHEVGATCELLLRPGVR